MRCPRDNEVLQRERLEGVVVDVCPDCHGIWLDEGELRSLVRHFSTTDPSDAEELLERWVAIRESGATAPRDFWCEDSYICPKEGAQMQKHYFAGSQIGVDNCRVCHSFWIDGPELAAIAEYVEPNPVMDKLGRYIIEESNDWYAHLPETPSLKDRAYNVVAALVSNPPMALVLLGMLVIHLITREVDDSLPVA